MSVRVKVKPVVLSFGARVRLLRESRGFNQTELARKMKVAPAAVAQIECGRNANPTLATINRLASALGITTAELLSDEIVNQVQTGLKKRIHVATVALDSLKEEYAKLFGTHV